MSKELEVLNPYDLKAIGSVPMVDWDTVDGYLATATKAF